MPNWCTNEVSVYTETKEQMDEFISFVKSKENEEPFSFQSILPMPKELREVGSPVRIVSAKEYKERDIQKDIFPNQLITKAMSDKFRVEYGADNWYDWANKYWGTKWEASYVGMERSDDNQVQYDFDTAWCPPEGVHNALVRRFPDLSISWFYREDGCELAGFL